VIDISNRDDEHCAEFSRVFGRYSKIHDHVLGISKLKISIQVLQKLVSRMRKVWLDTLYRALYFYRQAAATSILRCIFKGLIQFVDGDILVGKRFSLDTDSPHPLTKKHTSTYLDELLTRINSQQGKFRCLISR